MAWPSFTLPVGAVYAGGMPAYQPADVVSGSPISCWSGSGTAIAANDLNLQRIYVHKTGTLRWLYVNIATAAGNLKGLIYRCTDGVNLWTGTGGAAAIAWHNLGDPSIAVTAGDQLWIGFVGDNAACTRRGITTVATVTDLPTTWLSTTNKMIVATQTAANGGSYASPPTPLGTLTAGALAPAIAGVIE